jgi:hypothetical protein
MTKLTTREAAAYLAGDGKPFAVNTLEIWRLKGRGPRYLKLGKFVRYEQADLDEWLAERKFNSTSAYPVPERAAA